MLHLDALATLGCQVHPGYVVRVASRGDPVCVAGQVTLGKAGNLEGQATTGCPVCQVGEVDPDNLGKLDVRCLER